MSGFSAAYKHYLKDESGKIRPDTRKKRIEKYEFEWFDNSNYNLPEKITVLGEDGIGDEIFYAQFLPALAKQCKEVVWVLNWKDEFSSNENSNLLPLFQNGFCKDTNVSFRIFRAKENLPSNQVLFSK